MARRRANARRALARIEDAASARAGEIAQFIVDEIASNPSTPYDEAGHRGGQHLKYSYRAKQDPARPGSWIIYSTRRYWVFVEYGTGNHEAQPHVRPAIELARQVFR